MRYASSLAWCLWVWCTLTGCDRLAGGDAECPPAKAPECPSECPECPAAVRVSADSPAPDNGDIKLVYEPTKKKELEPLAAMVKEAKVFDKVVGAVNEIVALPRDAAVLFTDCDKINAYYDERAPGIVVCYELLGYFDELFVSRIRDPAQRQKVVLGAAFFGFLHELGHALVDQLELPVTGREEDAVDQLATIILVQSGTGGLDMALQGAQSFLLQAKDTSFEKTPFWDQHSFEEQRYYDIVCLAYGSAPKKLGRLVGDKGVPKERAATCPAEYERLRKAWTELLGPHAKG